MIAQISQLATAGRWQTVRIADLTGKELRQLADLADQRPARRRERADERLRRQLVRLCALMDTDDREAVLTELRTAHPVLVLADHFDFFLAARDRRMALPLEERGGTYLPCDVLADDDEHTAVDITVAA